MTLLLLLRGRREDARDRMELRRLLDSEAGEDSALARVELHRLVRLFDLKESPLLMTLFPRVVKFLSL